MTISMYQASVPLLIRTLNNLAAILEKGAAYSEAKKIDPTVLINTRLYPDMFPLGRQVQIASDISRRGVARLAGLEAPKYCFLIPAKTKNRQSCNRLSALKCVPY